MKPLFPNMAGQVLAVAAIVVLYSIQGFDQFLQLDFGHVLDNSFYKVVKDGIHY